MTSATTIESIGVYCLKEIFERLPLRDYPSCARVCKLWQNVVREHQGEQINLWRKQPSSFIYQIFSKQPQGLPISQQIDRTIVDREKLLISFSEPTEFSEILIRNLSIDSLPIKDVEELLKGTLIGLNSRYNIQLNPKGSIVENLNLLIPQLDEEELSPLIVLCSRLGHDESLNALIGSPQFESIELSTLENVSVKNRNGHLNYLKALINSSRLEAIDPRDLGEALVMTAQLGHLNFLKALISSSRLGEISRRDLGVALETAARHGHLNCLNALISSPRFGEIESLYFVTALSVSDASGHIDCFRALFASGRCEQLLEA